MRKRSEVVAALVGVAVVAGLATMPGRAQEPGASGPTRIRLRFLRTESAVGEGVKTLSTQDWYGCRPFLTSVPRPPFLIGLGSTASHGAEPGGNGVTEQWTEMSAQENEDKTITLHYVWRGTTRTTTHACDFTRRLAPGRPVRVTLLSAGGVTDILEVSADRVSVEPVPGTLP